MNLKPKHKDLEINITPLIDVVFLLLIFFMITTSFRHDAPIRIDPPESPSEGKPYKNDRVEVWVDKDGQYFVDREPVEDKMSALRKAIKISAMAKKDAPLVICADADVNHESVVRAMTAATDVGFEKAAICTMKINE